MNLIDVENTLYTIGVHVRSQLKRFDIEPVSFGLDRSRLRIGVGSGVESQSFVVQTSVRSWATFEVWDWDDEVIPVWGDMPLQDLQAQQVAGLLCAVVRSRNNC